MSRRHPSPRFISRGPSTSSHAPASAVRPIAFAVHLTFSAAVLGAALWTPLAQAQQAGQARQYSIPAGSLNAVLNRFAEEAGVLLGAPGNLTSGKSSAGLNGRYGVQAGFAAVLARTGLEAFQQGDGSYGLRTAYDVSADAVGTAALQTVTVSGKAPGSTTEGTGSYTTFSTSSSTRLNLTPQETPQPITVITRQRMDDQGLVSLNDVLEATSGVTVKPFNVGADGPQIWARGASITNFQVDGIPSATLMSNYLQSAVMYDRVEVVKGATGMMSGLGTPAATINMIRKRPTKEPQATASAETGNWSRHGAGLDMSRALSEDGAVRARLVADYKRQGAWTDNYAQDYAVLYGIGEIDLGARTLLTAGLSHIQRNTNAQIRTFPVVYTNGQPTGARLSDGAPPDWTYYDHQMDSAFGAIEHRFDSGWNAKAELTHGRYRYDSVMATLGGVVDQATGSGAYALMPRYNAATEQTSLDAYVTGPFSLFGRQHELIAGLTLSRLTQDSPSYPTVRQNITNIFNWAHEIPRPGFTQSGSTALKEYQYGAYLSSRLQLSDNVNLLLGGRVTDWQRDRRAVTGASNTTTDTHNKEKSVLIPYAGLVYALNDRYSLYASYTRIFRPQDSGTLMYTTGGQMDPEEGSSYEAGLKASFQDGALTSSLSLFRTQQKNLAVWNAALYSYVAETHAATEGIELEVNGRLAPGWQLSAGYNYSETRDQNGSRILPRIPRNTFKLFTSYRLPGDWNRLTLGGGVQWESKTGDPLTTYAQSSHAQTHLMARYEVSPQLAITAHLHNAFDKRYAMAIASNFAIYGPPRNFMLSAKYRF